MLLYRYYINPLNYGFKILLTNEFISEKWGVMGIRYLEGFGLPTSKDDRYLWFIALLIMHFTCI